MHTSSPTAPASPANSGKTVLRYEVNTFSEHWIIPEEIPVPESAWHDGCLDLFRQLLAAWVQETSRDAAVFRDLAIRPRRDLPRVGFNPDVCLVEPAPPGAAELESLRLWEHTVPTLAFESVSASHPYKDYTLVPEKCAVVGVAELVVFDPLLAGPRAQGGPWLLQVWRRAPDDTFERVHEGSDSAWSTTLGAYLVPNQDTRRLTIAAHADGRGRWLTGEERALERERAALKRVAELEAELARRGG